MKRIRCLIACCNSQIIVENFQVDKKPFENDKEELLKKLYYDLKCPAAYAGKSKVLQKMGNNLKMTKEELLKKLYYDLKKPAAYCWKIQFLQEAKKHDSNISIEDVEEWLKSQWEYTFHKPVILNFKTRSVVVHWIDE